MLLLRVYKTFFGGGKNVNETEGANPDFMKRLSVKQESTKVLLSMSSLKFKDLTVSFAAAGLYMCIFLLAWAISIHRFLTMLLFNLQGPLLLGKEYMYKGFSKQELPVHDKPESRVDLHYISGEKTIFLLISQPASY